jgi:dihydropteroate synthase
MGILNITLTHFTMEASSGEILAQVDRMLTGRSYFIDVGAYSSKTLMLNLYLRTKK